MSKHVKEAEQEGEQGFDAEGVYSNVNDVGFCFLLMELNEDNKLQEIDTSTRDAISRVTGIIRVLSAHFIPLTDSLLLDAYEWCIEHETGLTDLLQEEFGESMVAALSSQ